MEIQHNNGKPKGRAFIHFLAGFLPAVPVGEEEAAENTGGGLIISP
jgi:hypothetical protein